ncbi:hypothetical protein [Amycolatopsis japonica]
MNNSEDGTFTHETACAQCSIPAPRVLSSELEPPRAASLPWSNVVDGWVRDRTVRRDALIGLTLLLIAVVSVVCAFSGTLAPFVKDAVGNAVVRVVAGIVIGGGALGYGGLRLRRHLARQAKPSGEAGGTPDSAE